MSEQLRNDIDAVAPIQELPELYYRRSLFVEASTEMVA